MNLKLYSLILFLLGATCLSCKTANKLYETGHYDEAVEMAAKKLQKKPDDPKLLNVLKESYRFAVDDHESRIRNFSASSSALKFESIYVEYISLQRLYESIYRSPDVFNRIKPTDYSSFVSTYAEKAGQARYDRALVLMENEDIQSYREAYAELKVAHNYLPDHTGIRNLMDEAFDNSVVNVIVLPLEERSSYQYSSYNSRYKGFDNNVLRYLQQNRGNEFIRYLTPQDARNRNIRVDHIVDIRFNSISVGRSAEDNNTRTVSQNVVIKERVYRPDSIVKEYAKVYANITTTKRTMRSEGLIQVKITDSNKRQVWKENYSGHHFWTTEFASYTGDIRALSETDKTLVNQSRQEPPKEEDIIRCIMDEIQSKLECGVRDYFYKL